MANSKYEYVRLYEQPDRLLPQSYIVVRVDGRKFHQFSKRYDFAKPNDLRALSVMNAAACGVLKDVPDICLAYGDSDEYSFLFLRDTELFDRRESKIVSTVVSTFTAHYILNWSLIFPEKPLSIGAAPSFDGRAVLYPHMQLIRDYFSWRQADCHINNLYNTVFWALVLKGNMTPDAAETRLKGTVAADKNEILFSEFGLNYNAEPEIFKKGTLLKWSKPIFPLSSAKLTKRQEDKRRKSLGRANIETFHQDLIRDVQLWADLQLVNEGESKNV